MHFLVLSWVLCPRVPSYLCLLTISSHACRLSKPQAPPRMEAVLIRLWF